MAALSVWADISLMWLIFLTLFIVVPIGAILFYAVKGMRRLRFLIKLYAPIVQDKAKLVADKAEKISDKIAAPIIRVQMNAAQVNSVTKAILRRNGT